MKNAIIAALITYVFYTDFCVIKLWYLIPLMFLVFWGLIASVDELIKDYQKQVLRGQRLQNKLRRAERRWSTSR